MTCGDRANAAVRAERRLPAGLVLVALLVATLPSGVNAGLSSWDTLANDLPATLRAIDVAGGTGWAVGDDGLILQLVDDAWVVHDSPTTRDLTAVAVRDATHAVAVGAGGIVLEYGPGDDGALRWAVSAPAGSLGVGSLHAAAFLDGKPLAVGTGGALVIEQAAGWVVHTIASGKTFRGISIKESVDAAYLVGSATGGDSGAVMYRYHNGNWNAVTIPTGAYGLHDIDIEACRAVGSGGHILRCLNGNPATWIGHVVQGGHRFDHLSQDPNRPDRVWAAGTDSNGNGVLYHNDDAGDSETWTRRILPVDDPVTALAPGLGGIITGLVDQILVLRPHAPVITSLPTSTTGYQGDTITVPFSADDDDGDQLIPELIPGPELPPGVPVPNVREIIKNVWEMVWIPPYDVEGLFNFTVVISDGDDNVTGNTTIIILDENGPPFWDPHPDVVIPYGIPFTTQAQAHDPDNDPLTLTGPVIPPGSVFTDLGAGLAQLDWTPTLADVGTHPITFTADDGNATGDLDFDITVVDNQPPVIDWHTPSGSICVAGAFHSGIKWFSAGATDPEGSPLTFEWTFHDDNSVAFGTTVSHLYAVIGIHQVTLTVTDDVGLTDTAHITVRADDCVTLVVEPDSECVDFTKRASGVLRFFDHLGQPISGTYEMRAEWDNVLGQPQSRRVTGTIDSGFAFYQVPFDLDPIPLNDHGEHYLYFKAYYPNSPLGDTEVHAVTITYYMSYNCEVLKDKDDDG